jgi:hypothetical protein
MMVPVPLVALVLVLVLLAVVVAAAAMPSTENTRYGFPNPLTLSVSPGFSC